MKKIFALLTLVLATCITAMAATPAEVLDRAARKLKNAMSIYADYTLTADGHSNTGTILMSADRFTITSPEMLSWYDGKTQWTYAKQIGEVNVVTPTPDELQQVNPFAIIRSFSRDYKASALPSPAGTTKLRLTNDTGRGDIDTVDITFSDSTGYPTQMSILLNGGQRVNIKVHGIRDGGPQSTSKFKFNPKDFPGVQVVDLR